MVQSYLMNTLVEIGGGDNPGPRFGSVQRHISVDTDFRALSSAALRVPDVISQYGDATSLSDFPDGSVDIVLARNVFGDGLLGIPPDQKTIVIRDMLNDIKLASRVHENANYIKLMMLGAACRVLVDGGRLIVVERYSPDVARRFFQDETTRTTGGLGIEKARLSDVAPANYVAAQASLSEPAVWLGTKNL